MKRCWQAGSLLEERQSAFDSASTELRGTQRDISTAQEELTAANTNLERLKTSKCSLQEYSSKLQEYNTKLQGDLSSLQLSNAKVQEDKAAAAQLVLTLTKECELAQGHLEVMSTQACNPLVIIYNAGGEGSNTKSRDDDRPPRMRGQPTLLRIGVLTSQQQVKTLTKEVTEAQNSVIVEEQGVAQLQGQVGDPLQHARLWHHDCHCGAALMLVV